MWVIPILKSSYDVLLLILEQQIMCYSVHVVLNNIKTPSKFGGPGTTHECELSVQLSLSNQQR